MIEYINRETIEKAAREFTDNLIAENYFDVNYEEDNYDAGSLNATDEVGFNAFIKGAEWRINSVWHDTSEKPEKRRKYLAHCKDDRFHTFCDSTDWDMFLIRSNIKHWAYIDDLFPDKLKGGNR